jgi:hypothetical protein
VTRIRGRRSKQVPYDLKETRGYRKLKYGVWRTRLDIRYGPALRQTTQCMCRSLFTPGKEFKPRYFVDFEILIHYHLEWFVLSAVGMIFNAGSCDPGKLGYSTRLIAKYTSLLNDATILYQSSASCSCNYILLAIFMQRIALISTRYHIAYSQNPSHDGLYKICIVLVPWFVLIINIQSCTSNYVTFNLYYSGP